MKTKEQIAANIDFLLKELMLLYTDEIDTVSKSSTPRPIDNDATKALFGALKSLDKTRKNLRLFIGLKNQRR